MISKTLVAYFSAGGRTAKVAAKVAAAAKADLYEIRPRVPYTKADLDWTDPHSRSSVEMADKSFRPAMADHAAEIAAYDTVFIGFPIWWYVAPTIINTFLEAYDFSGKKVVAFATSGGSGLGKTESILRGVCPQAQWVPGKRLSSGADAASVEKWVKTLDI